MISIVEILSKHRSSLNSPLVLVPDLSYIRSWISLLYRYDEEVARYTIYWSVSIIQTSSELVLLMELVREVDDCFSQ
jgi:hypothetical protein